MATDERPRPFPPYAFVPGGPWPHPIRSSQGHSFGRTPLKVETIDRDLGARSPTFLWGIELFNAGYYWEAHEAWEALWHSYGRKGARADVVKALIKLAAAGVKVRERQEHGVRTHAARAAEQFGSARNEAGRRQLGLDLDEWIERAGQIARDPPADPGPRDAPVVRVFAFQIEIDRRDA
jgi:predicted metal-dependent hydrolase